MIEAIKGVDHGDRGLVGVRNGQGTSLESLQPAPNECLGEMAPRRVEAHVPSHQDLAHVTRASAAWPSMLGWKKSSVLT
jgi:hypothetical protein